MCSFINNFSRANGPVLSGSFAMASSPFLRGANRGDYKEPAHPIRLRSLSSLPFVSVSSQWGTASTLNSEAPSVPSFVSPSAPFLPTHDDTLAAPCIPSAEGDTPPPGRANRGPTKKRGVSLPPTTKPCSGRKGKLSHLHLKRSENEIRNKPTRRASSKSDRRRSHRRAAQSHAKKDLSPKRNGQSHGKKDQSPRRNGHSHRTKDRSPKRNSRSSRRVGRSRRRIGRSSTSRRRINKRVLPLKSVNIAFPTPPDRTPCMTPFPKSTRRPKSTHSPKSPQCGRSNHRPRSTHRTKSTHRHSSTRRHKSPHRPKSRKLRNRCNHSSPINPLDEKRRCGHLLSSPKGERLTAKQVQEGLFAPLLGSLDEPETDDPVKRLTQQNYTLGHQYMPFSTITHRVYQTPFSASRTRIAKNPKNIIPPAVNSSNSLLFHTSKTTLSFDLKNGKSDSYLPFGRIGISAPLHRRPKSNLQRLSSCRRRSEYSMHRRGSARLVSHSASPHRRIQRPFDGLFCALPRPNSARPIRSAIP